MTRKSIISIAPDSHDGVLGGESATDASERNGSRTGVTDAQPMAFVARVPASTTKALTSPGPLDRVGRWTTLRLAQRLQSALVGCLRHSLDQRERS
jgi:hypothetical protein